MQEDSIESAIVNVPPQPRITQTKEGAVTVATPNDQHQLSHQKGSRLRATKAAVILTGSILVGLAIWQVASQLVGSTLMSSPSQVVRWASSYGLSNIMANAEASWRRVLVGFLAGSAAAIPTGLLMGWYRPIRTAFDPWIQFFRNVPALALIPLMILLLGIGETPKYVVIAIAAFLPTTVAVLQGVMDVDRNLINAAKVLGAKQRQIFRLVVIPSASPVILVGSRLALGSCWGTVVAAELISSKSGLGYMSSEGQLYFNVPEIYLSIILIGVSGLLMDRAMYLLQQHLTKWQERR